MAIVFPNMYACLFDFVGRMKVHSTIYQRVVAKKFYATKLNSTRSPQSHQCLNGFFLTVYCCCFISAYSFHNYLSLYGSKPSIGIKALPIFRSSGQRHKKQREKIRISPKSKLNGNNISLICNPEEFYCSIDLGQARCKRIFQVLLLSSHF